MNNMIELSVIMPIFNSSKYLRKTLESAISFFGNEIDKGEILLIDDGSTDSSVSIAKEFKNKIPQIKIIEAKHEGVSSSRNIGILKAKGKYITFFDSDDLFLENYFNKFRTMIKENPDIILTDIETLKSDSFICDLDDNLRLNMMKLVLRGRGNMGISSKFYKTKFIKENSLYYNKKIIIGEDMLFILKAISYCKSIYLSPSKYYFIPKSHTLNRYHKDFYDSERELEEEINNLLRLYKNEILINYICNRIKINGLKNFIDCYYAPLFFNKMLSLRESAEMLKKTIYEFDYKPALYAKGFSRELGKRLKLYRFFIRKGRYKSVFIINNVFLKLKMIRRSK
ncbi:glycosyltransferase family 2 protein [Limosilactobacillus reuteri subsp. suis]|uniref:glycosyltransferase family 2 protein n=1 Tax=Limosilactobacillus reuteri TaxID=1598 RepID=UPI003992B0A2